MSRGTACRRGLAVAAAAFALAAPASASAAQVPPADTLTYLPFGFLHDEHSAELIQETLGQMSEYGIGQVLLPMPNFKKDGTLKLSRKELRMIPRWAAGTGEYDAAHGSAQVLVASFGGKVKGKSLNLEEPAVRARMLAGIETVLAFGVGGVSLDLEPYPTSPGFLDLLAEVDVLLERHGLAGGLAVTAPATVGRWSPSYLSQVTALAGQVDPLFYDSERTAVAAYEQWVREGLAYYSADAAASSRIVPDLPSYGANRWHDPAVENLATATDALEGALGEGSRVQGAGIFWWWGFYYDEEGEGSYDGAADRQTWLTRTLFVPFSP